MIGFLPQIKGETIETVYQWYNQNMFLVNRKYQRKLVWTIEEKTKFVETIQMGLPVPLFLLAKKKYTGKEILEIIDGMQRLNAIVSFIEGEFPLNNCYFNLEANASLKYLKDCGKLKQKTPVLDNEICAKIASYQLPISTTLFENDQDIEEAFKRINSSGKHLSQQELRQAGADSLFSNLVRSISEEIRGDVSHTDFVTLDKMKCISLSSRDLGYGITMRNIFWAKNGIITTDNIRESRDEELVAHILVAIISDLKIPYTARNLNKAYGFTPLELNDIDIDELIKKKNPEDIKMKFDVIYNETKKIIEAINKPFWNILFTSGTASHVNRAYYIVFLSIYNLIINQGLKIINYKEIAEHLKDEGTKTIKDEDIGKSCIRQQLINKISGIIRCDFEERNCNDPMLSNWVNKIDTLLACVGEDIGLDFKIGFYRMDSKNFLKPNFDNALTTLLSMANKGKDSIGYVLVGIADKVSDATRHDSFYSTNSILSGNYNVVGINAEALKSYGSVDKYRQKFEQYIQNVDIKPQEYKDYILKNIQFVNYYDKTIILLQIKGLSEPAVYKNVYYHRIGTSTTEVGLSSMKSLFESFL